MKMLSMMGMCLLTGCAMNIVPSNTAQKSEAVPPEAVEVVKQEVQASDHEKLESVTPAQ